MKIGVLPLGRATFDLAAGAAATVAARAVLDETRHEVIGPNAASTDDALVSRSVFELGAEQPDLVVVLQGTFTTAVAVEALMSTWSGPVVLWGFPEPPGSDRLRLNSLCGITLASYTLHRLGADVRWIYGDPADPATRARLRDVLDDHVYGRSPPRADPARSPRRELPRTAVSAAHRVARGIRDTRIGRLGPPPDGYGPCTYDAPALFEHLGVVVDELSLDTLFAAASASPADAVAAELDAVPDGSGVRLLDRDGVDRSARLLTGLRELVQRHQWHAVSTRCWPECMTDYGAAVCWPSAVLAEEGIPAGCEADVYGTVTNLALQMLTGRPAFLADLVAVDRADNTGTLWHCGVAAASLARADTPVTVRNHPNRPVPMVHDFGLAPGRITMGRLTQRPSGRLALVIGGGKVLDTDHHVRGTSAVVELDRPVPDVLDRVLGDGLDHHISMVYGDVRDELEALAGEWDLQVIDV